MTFSWNLSLELASALPTCLSPTYNFNYNAKISAYIYIQSTWFEKILQAFSNISNWFIAQANETNGPVNMLMRF